jgi:homospermidine synthase
MKIFMVGSGAVAQCTLPILLKELDVEPSSVTVMDFVDNRHRIREALEQGVNFVQEQITKENYDHVLSTYLSPGDMFIDLSWNIDTIILLSWCYEHDVNYVNSSVELWDPYAHDGDTDPCNLTLYVRQLAITELIESLPNKKGATAIVDHGANPGLVSHFTKQALEDIAAKLMHETPKDPRIPQLKQALNFKNFAVVAQLLGVKVVQIAERDSQITSNPKKMNEFVNTWSVQGLYEEGIAPSEIGWGTHEHYAPKGIRFHQRGPQNQVCLMSRGIDTLVRSWVPSGDIIGMVIRHGEAYGISERLTVWHEGTAVYRPTVYFSYCLSDSAIASLYELKMRQLELQPNIRIINDDIIDGKDELGCFLLGHDYKAWWIGSLLDIHEARKLVPHQNATTVQVAIAIVAAVQYMIKHPNEGICLPDDIDHREILSFAKPYLGPFISQAVDWSPLTRKPTYLDYDGVEIDSREEWQFTSFLVSAFDKIKLK